MEVQNMVNMLNEIQRSNSTQSHVMESIYNKLIVSLEDLAKSNRELAEAIKSNGIKKG